MLSLIRLHRNDLRGARDAADVTAGQLSDAGPRQRGNWSAWAQALLLEADGELAQALAMLGECWDRCASGGLAREYPVIGTDLVRLALAAGDAARARDATPATAAVTSRARAEAALRQMGIRRGRHVTHRRAQSGWLSLTPSERAVVDLVAEGLSNPQIGLRLYVSRRTVQTHLAHVFARLHITSRTQLAAEAIRHRG